MQEFPSDPEPFDHIGANGEPDHSDDVYHVPPPDDMSAPDFYRGQGEEPDVATHLDAAVEPAPFMEAFEPVGDHQEVHAEDLTPISEPVRALLLEAILTKAADGIHIKGMDSPDSNTVIPRQSSVMLISDDNTQRLRVRYFPNLGPQDIGEPILADVEVTDNVEALAAHTRTVYLIRPTPEGSVDVEKYATLEEAVAPPEDFRLDDIPTVLYEAIQRYNLHHNNDRMAQDADARQQGREMGLSFVSENEALLLIRKMLDADLAW